MTWHNKPKKERKNYSKDSEEPLSEPRINTISEDREIFGPISPNQQWFSSCYRIDACSDGCVPFLVVLAPRKNADQNLAELDPQQQTSAAAALRKKPEIQRRRGASKRRDARQGMRDGGEVNRTRRSGLKRRMREEQRRT